MYRQPKIGDIVVFTQHHTEPLVNEQSYHPGIVTKVYEDASIDLTVFFTGVPSPQVRSGVSAFHEDIGDEAFYEFPEESLAEEPTPKAIEPVNPPIEPEPKAEDEVPANEGAET